VDFPPGLFPDSRYVMLLLVVLSQQFSEQFRILRADHHLEFTNHAFKMVGAQRI